jgi:hypothetical protein
METEVFPKSHESGDTARSCNTNPLDSHDPIACPDRESERTLDQWLRDYYLQVAALGRS